MTAETSAQVARVLYEKANERDRKFSIGFLAKKLAYKSRGNFSDVLSGRRILALNKVALFGKVFNLNREQSECLRLLARRDRARSATERRQFTEKLRRARQLLLAENSKDRKDVDYFALKVSTAFNLSGGEASLAELIGFFGREKSADVEAAVDSLSRAKLIELNENGRYSRTRVWNSFSAAALFRANLEDSIQSLEIWRERRDWSRFFAIMICAKEKDYLKALERIRIKALDELMKIENQNGDMIVNFGMQLFPTLSAARSMPSAGKSVLKK